ncbi:MAG: hypothetical protein JWQ35_556, partial [Bacteriovoracaceae bacterium]|nr:hypothetical protein [Bacteriovoracaceae bacterium]
MEHRILISGSSGLVGSDLLEKLKKAGNDCFKLVRRNPVDSNEIFWNPEGRILNSDSIEGFDAVIHLAGENIAGSRWSKEFKKKIRDSRVHSTELLSSTLSKLKRKPSVFICASAAGYYGNRGSEELTEDSPAGSGFLAEVCKDWEAATLTAKNSGIRVANLRTGMVLSEKGGALKKMLPPFKIGIGGAAGDGSQYVSWITLDDLTR